MGMWLDIDDVAAEHPQAKTQLAELRRELDNARDERDRLRAGIIAVQELIDESIGVVGLHRNGDVAPWGELRTGGRFEEWLRDFDAAANAT